MKLSVRINAWWPDRDIYQYVVKVSEFSATKTITGAQLAVLAKNLPAAVPRICMTAEEMALAILYRGKQPNRDIVGQKAIVDTQETSL